MRFGLWRKLWGPIWKLGWLPLLQATWLGDVVDVVKQNYWLCLCKCCSISQSSSHGRLISSCCCRLRRMKSGCRWPCVGRWGVCRCVLLRLWALNQWIPFQYLSTQYSALSTVPTSYLIGRSVINFILFCSTLRDPQRQSTSTCIYLIPEKKLLHFLYWRGRLFFNLLLAFCSTGMR